MAPPDQGSAHPITAYYSFIDFERMKGWVGLVGWPCSGQFTRINGHPSAAGGAWDRDSLPVTDRRSTTVPRNQQPGILCKINITYLFAPLSFVLTDNLWFFFAVCS